MIYADQEISTKWNLICFAVAYKQQLWHLENHFPFQRLLLLEANQTENQAYWRLSWDSDLMSERLRWGHAGIHLCNAQIAEGFQWSAYHVDWFEVTLMLLCRPLIVQMVTNAGEITFLVCHLAYTDDIADACMPIICRLPVSHRFSRKNMLQNSACWWLAQEAAAVCFSLTQHKISAILMLWRSAECLEPRCRIQAEDSEEYGPIITPASNVAQTIKSMTEAHLRQTGTPVSAKPIVMRAE